MKAFKKMQTVHDIEAYGTLGYRFKESYAGIDFKHLEDTLDAFYVALNDFDSLLYMIDRYNPTRFFEIVGKLRKVIQKWK